MREKFEQVSEDFLESDQRRWFFLGLILALALLVLKLLRDRQRRRGRLQAGDVAPEIVIDQIQSQTVTSEPAAPVSSFPPAFQQREGNETRAPQPSPAEGLSAKDDLKRLDGIGPKYEQLLNQAGIQTYTALAATGVDRLKEIFADQRLAYPETWPEQAGLAAKGDWDGLAALQSTLRGGRRIE